MTISKFSFGNFLVYAAYILFAIGILGAPIGAFAQEASKEDEALFVAKKAFDDGFYEVSIGLLDRFLKNYPTSEKLANAELLIGRCFFQQGKYLQALQRFESLLKLPAARSSYDALFYWMGEVHFKGNSFNKAREYYLRIMREMPHSTYVPAAYYSLGWCYFQENKFKDAKEYFTVVEEKYPASPQAMDASFKIIESLYNLKEYAALKEKVSGYLLQGNKDSSSTAYLTFYLAEAQFYSDNFDEAIIHYTNAISYTYDEKIKALSQSGVIWSYLKLKRYQEAEDALSHIKIESLEEKSQDSLMLAKALIMVETNRTNEAKNIYDSLIHSTADQGVLLQAYLGKADALYNLSSYAQAVSTYQEALTKTKEDTSSEFIEKLHYGLSWALLKQGEFKEAIKEFQKIAKDSEDKIVKTSALCQIGDAYQDSGEYASAQKTYDKIINEYPDSLYSDYVQYQLGMLFLKTFNYDGAIMAFGTLKKNFPESKLADDATYALGLTYFQSQDYRAARDVLESFRKLYQSPLAAQTLYLLGASLYNLGEYDSAIEVFKDIIPRLF
ncbi:MAG: tetratricopeptide repeat protein [Candidatus Omnitrophica bacterium]|nr:tetratricopeptide repeat protein [Candidatus Omnitrophota bacterium]